jgi:hypothetical protein
VLVNPAFQQQQRRVADRAPFTLNPLQVNKLRKEGQIDEHFFEKQTTGEDIEFEAGEDEAEAPAEINVDTI